ncbi:MAG: endoglucanase, partial [Proteiniphilum sp.]|nr:endoglucanase [Proteiniphilum sp.]
MKRIETLFILVFLCSLFPFSETKANKHISPHHPYIRYSGRVDRSKKESVSFDWPGVAIRCHFTGSSVGIKMNGGKDNYFNLFIDNELISVFHAPRDTTLVIGTLNRKDSHELRITKRTEADMGMTRFMGIILDDEGALEPVPNIEKRRIEFIGNSITCGYGTEGNNRDERFRPDTENSD